MAADPPRDESNGAGPYGRRSLGLSEPNFARPGLELHGETSRLLVAGAQDNG